MDCIDKEVKISQDILEFQNKKTSKTMEELLLLKKKNKMTPKPNQTFKLPPSSVLGQVKQFLPVMAEANTKLDRLLQEVPASDLDIENVEDTEGPVIEMDIALGLLNDSSSSEDDTSDTDSEDSDYDGDLTEKTEANIKITKQKHKPPYIEEIIDQTNNCSPDIICESDKTTKCNNGDDNSDRGCEGSNDKDPHR